MWLAEALSTEIYTKRITRTVQCSIRGDQTHELQTLVGCILHRGRMERNSWKFQLLHFFYTIEQLS